MILSSANEASHPGFFFAEVEQNLWDQGTVALT